MKDIIRMQQLAGVITEGQAKKSIEVLNEESSQSNGKNLDFYKENFKLLKTKETPKSIIYMFELPQEINNKVINDNPEQEKLYRKQNYFTITVPKLEGLYKPSNLYLPQNDALEDYINTL